MTPERILVEHVCRHYIDGQWRDNGTRIVEAHFFEGEWRIWLGSPLIETTEKLRPVKWWPKMIMTQADRKWPPSLTFTTDVS